jgi:WD40 repeat protein
MACEFSAPYAHSSIKNIVFSPDSQYLAYIHGGTNLCIRENRPSHASTPPQTETIHHIFSCIDKIDKIEFSRDSEYIYCGIYNRSTVQIFSVSNFQWRCRINESIAGMVSVTWAPDSRHVLVESDFGIQLAIWSLLENTSYIIHSPKPNCLTFSDCQRYLVLFSD